MRDHISDCELHFCCLGIICTHRHTAETRTKTGQLYN